LMSGEVEDIASKTLRLRWLMQATLSTNGFHEPRFANNQVTRSKKTSMPSCR
jgi:hypothetical protein